MKGKHGFAFIGVYTVRVGRLRLTRTAPKTINGEDRPTATAADLMAVLDAEADDDSGG